MQKVLITILAATTLVLGILCVVQRNQLRAGNERMRAAEEAWRADTEVREAQSTRVKQLESANERLDEQVQQFVAATPMPRPNEAREANQLTTLAERVRAARKNAAGDNDNSSGEGKEGFLGNGMEAMLGKMLKDPAMREMLRGQQKATINMMYSGLFKELNLSSEEKEKVTGILVDSQMKNVENAQGIFGEKKEGAAEDTSKLFVEAKKQTDAELTALLGDERFAQYEDYQKNIGERMQLDQLKTKMAAEHLPLQDDQMAQLLQVMKEEKAAVPPVMPTDNTQVPKKELFTAENFDKQIEWMAEYNRRVLDRAGQILSPEQLKQYQEFQEQQATMQKLGMKMARQMFGGDKSGSPPEPVAPNELLKPLP